MKFQSAYLNELVSGISYTALGKYTSVLLRIIVSAILGRKLTSDDFGVAGVATVFINFCAVISVSGITPAIVQNLELTREDIKGIFAFSAYLALFGMLFVIVCSPVVGFIYENKVLVYLVATLSLAVFFSILAMVPNALALRQKDFKFISIRLILVELFVTLVSIVSIYAGAGIYTLVIMPIASAFLMFLLTFQKYRITPSLTFHISSIKKIFTFSSNQIGFNICNYLYRNVDKLLLGKFHGMSNLGYYDKANHLVMLPINNVSLVVSPVLHPLWSKFQDDKSQIKNKYLQIVKILALIGFPISGVTFFSAREIILCLWGDQWEPSVPLFQFFSLNIGILIVQSAVGPAFQALNYTRGLLLGAIFSICSVSVFLTIGLVIGTNLAVVLSLTGSFFLIFFFYHHLLFSKCLNVKWIEFALNFKLPILCTIGFAGMAWALNHVIRVDNLFVFAAIKFTIMGLCSIPVLLYFFKKIKSSLTSGS